MRKLATRFFFLFAALGFCVLSGCSALLYNPDKSTTLFLDSYNIKPPVSPFDFTTCNHYNCEGGGAAVRLSAEEWQGIQRFFTPSATSASEERERIAQAVALMEDIVGQQNQTFADQACNNFQDPIESNQLDCVAETVNTTIYLLLLEGDQLLRWHQVSYPAHRSVAAILFPHFSAVIKETANKDLYVVDSWFYANGKKATVVPLDLWLKIYFPAPCS